MKRSPLKRGKPPRRMSEKRIAEIAERRAFSKAVIATAETDDGRWQCRRCSDRYAHWSFLHAHHRLPISQGGKHNPENGAAICFRCHRLVHDHGSDEFSPWWDWIVVRNTLGKTA